MKRIVRVLPSMNRRHLSSPINRRFPFGWRQPLRSVPSSLLMRIPRSAHLFICLSAFVELCCGPPIDKMTKDRPLANAAVLGDAQRLERLIATGLDVNDAG